MAYNNAPHIREILIPYGQLCQIKTAAKTSNCHT